MDLKHIMRNDVLLTSITLPNKDDDYNELYLQYLQSDKDTIIPQFSTDVYHLYFEDESEIHSLTGRRLQRHG
uniref:Uncharacterized protein n=1 Tax=Litopenaeus vannamei majanivirus Nimav-1_LVa TaxID=2984273 RepID=A0A9C7BYV0_9VIRU|nr:MAG: hypothetical protein [Litopenaeus vannamei majanivirus Nimav-1_LVa]